MTIVDKSRSPYFDDYKEDKQYYEVLFVPQRAVQVRELNQLQTMFYEQVGRFGSHVFEEGSVVIPGESNYDLELNFVAVSINDYQNVVNRFGNENITIEDSSGIKANLKIFRQPEGVDPAVFYVEYMSSDAATGDQNVFPEESLLSIKDNDGEFATAVVESTGKASKFTLSSGVWFINGRFVLVPEETVLLDKYGDTPSAVVCIEYNEKVVTENDDSSLFDNAQGTPNFSAPGAHRLGVDVGLKVYDLADKDTIPDNMVEIFRIEEGNLQKKAKKPDYAVLNDVMAQRTYEESGDYTVRAFNVGFSDHETDENKFYADLQEGLAYVKGYRVENLSTLRIPVDRARTTQVFNENSTSAMLGYYVEITSPNILPNIGDRQEVSFYDAEVTTPGEVPSGSVLGTARVRFMREDGTNYRLYLFDVRDTSGKRSTDFVANALSVYSSIGEPFGANLVDSVIKDSTNSSLVFPLSLEYVKSLYNDLGESDTSYASVKHVETTTDSNGIVTLSSSSNEVFVAQEDTFALASFTDTAEFVSVSAAYSLSGTPVGSAISLDFGSGNAGRPIRLALQTSKQAIKQKTKTTTQTTASGTVDADGVLSLGKADAFEIVSVIDSDTVDVTAKFELNPNKTPSMYGVSTVVGPQANVVYPVTVTFNYFSHSSGDFFGPDSYVDVPYEEIPVENGSRLTDVMDFRPRMSDDGSGFTSTGSSVGDIPMPYAIIMNDIEFYLGRKDKIYVTAEGEFGVKQGTPAINPKEPDDPDNSMILYTMDVPPYTEIIENVQAEKINNRRYTMRDIGQLENRIANVEYYVSLNNLEQETEGKQIVDPETGLNRFKNGFMTDSFVDHSVGDFAWPDYHVSMDEDDQQMRPEFSMNAIDLAVSTADSSHYTINNGIITLPYTNRSFIQQNFRSELMNVNPYAVFSWDGTVNLDPSIDSWIDTDYTNPEVNYRVFNNGRLTQSWRSWQLNWTGGTTRTSRSTTSTQRLGCRDRNWNWGIWSWNNWGQNNWCWNTFNRGDWIRWDDRVRRTTTTTTTTTRTNIDVVNDRIIDRSVIPFMRSINVDLEGIGNRPETRMHFFFDGTNVNQYVRPANGSLGDPVVTDVDGNFDAVFRIPNNRTHRFRTGEKQLVVTDENTGDREASTSWAQNMFTSSGIRHVRQRTINATRSIRTSTSSTSRITGGGFRRLLRRRWSDPLAQSFLVEREGGVFVTKIDTFFGKKDANVPVSIQLREMENGYPTQNIIPGGEKTLNPRDVNITSDGSVPTTFEFPYPVYLQDGQEYCFVIMSNSNNYEAHVARMGGKDKGTGKYIVDQPYAGVMFKSQNNSTWTADQNADLQFHIHSAKFDTSSNASVIMNNVDPASVFLTLNPIETTSGSSELKIFRSQHNYVVGSQVEISGAVGGNNIPATEINGTHVVTSVIDPNTFTIDAVSVADDTGLIGGENALISNTIQASLLNPNVPMNQVAGTDVRLEAKGTVGMSIDGNETPYTPVTSYIDLANEEENDLDAPWIITNNADEAANLSGNKSFTMRVSMFSSNDNVSPVVDMQGNSVITPFVLIDRKEAAETDGSNNWANYRTRVSGLKNPANSLKVFFDSLRPQESDVVVTARFGNSEEEIEDSEWVEVTPIVEQTTGTGEEFMENEYGLDNLNDFTFYQVMIQLKSNSSVRYPIIKRFRAIALGT